MTIWHNPLWRAAAVALLLSAASCGTESSEAEDADVVLGDDAGEDGTGDADTDAHSEDDAGLSGPTYYAHIRPMMAARCNECHVEDAIAPMALDTYEGIKEMGRLALGAMETGVMPPWPPSEECGPPLKNRRHISEEEIALFREWVEAGYPEGESGDAPELEGDENAPVFERGSPDLTLDWGFEYTPEPPLAEAVDDYRCFVIDPELHEDQFLNAVRTRPGNTRVVHHALVYSVSEDQAARLAQLEAEDERPGYTCFGGPRTSDPWLLSGWVPGTMPLEFEEGHGVRIEAGSKIVVQMHYNTVNDTEGSDRSLFDLYFVDQDETSRVTELVIIPLAELGLQIEAGDPDAVAVEEGPEIPISLTLHGVAPHMHLLGKSINVTAQTGTGEVCLMDIPAWDFNWQGFYLYEEPQVLRYPVTPRLECRYDNSPANQPDGRPPQEVRWGEGTYDEMCLTYFIVERPPGF
ncbi:hypothetical protein DV096_14470 [Bradymonadaceae bacterium TMQ3]|nr:hypothetical protein DV096_14470 [Bradymonadaceae bacterium TMQ3]TXC74876.1 hypothetical protein FRC91_15095 [Bradymonadales bacterium TMQ1]